MANILKNSIMVQFSRLLYEIQSTIFEKQILFLVASSFGIPDPLFGLYDVYIYHQVFIWATSELRFNGLQ